MKLLVPQENLQARLDDRVGFEKLLRDLYLLIKTNPSGEPDLVIRPASLLSCLMIRFSSNLHKSTRVLC